jgi:flagellar FliL protein
MVEEENEFTEEKEEIQKPEKKAFPVKILVISILSLLLLGGGVTAWKMGAFAQIRQKVKAENGANAKKSNKEIGPIQPLDTFIVNLTGQGRNYLKAKIELELDKEDTTAEINKRLPQLRDNILTTLSSKSFKDIATLEGKYQLRSELKASLNQYLTTGKVTNIYFTDFIVQ